METCSVDGCERPACRRGMCRRHDYRRRVHGDPLAGGPLRNTTHGGVCAFPGCDKPYLAAGLCAMHYARRKEHGDPAYTQQFHKDERCVVRGCTAAQVAKGLCGKHYQRRVKHGDPEVRLIADAGKGTVSIKGGYRVLFRPGHPGASKTGRIFEHRLVMSQMIGRALRPEESVHHVNGDKLDNRPENLELWSKSHPSGQRVSDLLEWARQIVALYGGQDVQIASADRGRG